MDLDALGCENAMNIGIIINPVVGLSIHSAKKDSYHIKMAILHRMTSDQGTYSYA